MVEHNLITKLAELYELPHETEWVEFKAAATSYPFHKLGKYFSALSNEANLKGQSCGWLVFGVNKNHRVCGSLYRENPAKLDGLKREISEQTGGISFREIHVVDHPDGRVVMFEIPPAPKGVPVSFQGHWYGETVSLFALLG